MIGRITEKPCVVTLVDRKTGYVMIAKLDSKRRRLFVIDGSKALRKAIDQVFGLCHPI